MAEEKALSTPAPPLALITGASGFIGAALCAALPGAGYGVRRALRTAASASASDAVVGDIDDKTDWAQALQGVDTVVHLAARTHVLHDISKNPLAQYHLINVAGTTRLAEEAAQARVRRFVFLSSVKVNGEETTHAPFRESDPPRPEDAYGATKCEAEDVLRAVARTSGFDLVVVRPPLVYGPRVKGNFLRLLRVVARGVPLPVGSIQNRRSMIYIGNLVDAVITCIRAPQAAGRTYLVRDDQDLSTPVLVRALAEGMGVRARVFAFPVAWLEAAGKLTGKSAEVARLTRSLQVDSASIRNELAWRPPFSAADGLRTTARWYHAHLSALPE